MHIRAGYELSFNPPQPTPILLLVSVHPSRAGDLLTPGVIAFDPPTPTRVYQDQFDNICTRVVAPAGTLTVATDFVALD